MFAVLKSIFKRPSDEEGTANLKYTTESKTVQRAELHVDISKVITITTREQWENCVPTLLEDLSVIKLLGLDTEWVTRDGKSRPVSLLQLATLQGTCILVRLHLLRHVPASLQDILKDKSIIKTGVAVCEDAKKLRRDYGLEVCGCVDLVHLVTRARISLEKKGDRGLQGITYQVLGVKISKNIKIRRGNWEAQTLSAEQVEYGCKDALTGAFVFWRLITKKLNPTSDIFFLEKNIENWNKALSCCQGLFELNVKHNQLPSSSNKPKVNNKLKPVKKTVPERSVSKAYVARKTPLYHHCALVAPDGQLLCTCDTKKAMWYIEKGLGVKIQDEPLKVQLTFEPSGRPIDENNYYTQDKLNICVVCGASGTYIRKSIIPHEYRKFFPQVMKEHRSHDVLLMCLPCHQRSNQYDAGLKEQLAQQCKAPLDSGENGRYKRDHSIHKVKSAAKALRLSNQSIPEERRKKLEETIMDHFNVDSVDESLLQQAVDLDHKVEKEDHVAHGLKVFNHYRESYNGLQNIERLWRQHFIDTMQPQYLPPGWTVDFRHDEMEKMHQALLPLSNAVVDLVAELLLG